MPPDRQSEPTRPREVAEFAKAWADSPAPPEIADFLPQSGGADPAAHRWLLAELIVVDIENRWRLAGKSPTVDAPPQDPAATVDRQPTGGSRTSLPVRPTLADYLARYRELGPLTELPEKLIECEVRLRKQYDIWPAEESYWERFGLERKTLWSRVEKFVRADDTHGKLAPVDTERWSVGRALKIRCPHCHQPVEILDDQPVAEITCPACNSTFNLLGSAAERSVPRKLAHFELRSHLGSGAFGDVWQAHDTKLGRLVAVKILRRTQVSPDEFLRDARAAAQLSHPNIVAVYEVGRQDDTVFIVSELIDGLPLDKWLQGQRLTPKESAALCRKIALAVEHAHRAGVVHRDLKPANVMMDRGGEPHVIDFGLAKREAGEITMTVQGEVLGTPAYMSPEQAKGDSHLATARSDVYSLGVILYELLTGALPFRANSRQALYRQIIEDDPPPPRKFDPHIPKDLETICLRCLEKSPDRRIPSAQALADYLQAVEDDRPIPLRPITHTERAWRWCKRNPVVAGLSAAVATTLCVGIVATSLFALDARRQAARADSEARQALENEAEAKKQAVLAEQQRVRADGQTARALDSEAEAKKQEAIAIENEAEAKRQAALAKENEAQAKKQEFIAEKNEAEAKRQAAFALENEAEAIRQAAIARENEAQAKEQEERASRRLYYSQIARVQQLWNDGQFSAAYDLLGHCHWDYRGWEHDYLYTKFARGRFAEHKGVVGSVAFSPDGKRIVSGGGDPGKRGELKVLDATSGEETLSLKGHSQYVTSVAFSPDGKRIASASIDNTIKVWDAVSGEETATLKGHTQGVMSVAFRPDGTRIASASVDKTIRVWDSTSGEETVTLKGHIGGVKGVAFSPDGKRIASGSADGTIKLWDAVSGQETLTPMVHGGIVLSVAFSPDGKRIASAAYDNMINVWDAMSRKKTVTLKGHTQVVASVAFSPDGKRIASGSGDVTIKVWDAMIRKKTVTLKGHTNSVRSVAFSPDGTRIASGSEDNTIKVWDAVSGEETVTLKGHSQVVMSVAFSPDGKRIASASYDNTIKVWDAVSGEETATLKGHTKVVTSVAFSPNGKRIASGSGDNTIKVWDATSGEETLTLKGHTLPVTSVAFSPDGTRIVSGSEDGTVKLWDATKSLKDAR